MIRIQSKTRFIVKPPFDMQKGLPESRSDNPIKIIHLARTHTGLV